MAANLDDARGEGGRPGETVLPCYTAFVLTIAPSDGGN